MEKKVKLEVFKKKCSNCGRSFEVLKFPDFEYGKRIIYTEDGRDYVLLESIDDVDYQEIIGMVRSLCEKNNVSDIDILECFDQIFGEISDSINSKKLDAQDGIYVCPNCQSKDTDIFDLDKPKYKLIDVPLVTYEKWNSKNKNKKEELILTLLEEKGCCGY